MNFKTKTLALLAFIYLGMSKVIAQPIDTLVTKSAVADTLNISAKILGGVTSKTKSMSDYFSLSNIIGK